MTFTVFKTIDKVYSYDHVKQVAYIEDSVVHMELQNFWRALLVTTKHCREEDIHYTITQTEREDEELNRRCEDTDQTD